VGGVPTSIGAFIDVPIDGADISSIRSGLTGAPSLPVAIREKFIAVTGKPLSEIYGMTEASGLISCNPFYGEGGTRGMIVNVKLIDATADDAQKLQEILNGFLFETNVT